MKDPRVTDRGSVFLWVVGCWAGTNDELNEKQKSGLNRFGVDTDIVTIDSLSRNISDAISCLRECRRQHLSNDYLVKFGRLVLQQ